MGISSVCLCDEGRRAHTHLLCYGYGKQQQRTSNDSTYISSHGEPLTLSRGEQQFHITWNGRHASMKDVLSYLEILPYVIINCRLHIERKTFVLMTLLYTHIFWESTKGDIVMKFSFHLFRFQLFFMYLYHCVMFFVERFCVVRGSFVQSTQSLILDLCRFSPPCGHNPAHTRWLCYCRNVAYTASSLFSPAMKLNMKKRREIIQKEKWNHNKFITFQWLSFSLCLNECIICLASVTL